jgi:serine/threonine protein kinase
LDKIASAVAHLHSLGLAHNDPKPSNIMLDSEDEPFLIDFGSCQKFGGSLLTGGTEGWIDQPFTTSDKAHDQLGLFQIRQWVETELTKPKSI